jgi:putative ATP-binding cassette transporter
MVWVAIVYAVFGTAITHWLGRPLIGLRFNQQRYEADFRFGLVRLRENAESIALYGGEQGERTGLRASFEQVWRNWWNLMRYTKRLGWFTFGYQQAALIFPFVVAAPRYFSGAIQLGGLIQISSAFGEVQKALSWFVTAYTDLVEWKASTDRLIGFDQAIAQASAEHGTDGGIREEPSANGLVVRDLDLDLPDGTPLLRDVDLAMVPGEQLRVSGPSGSGKSTLFRAIAGIWPFGKGQIALPEGSLFLPQRPYMPIGTLRAAVTFPAQEGAFTDEAVAAALRECGIEAYAGRLDESDHWGRRMSPGEQQRLAIARAVLHRPRWLFLDEATSALDEATERRLLALLHERLPDTAIVSITHRPAPAGDHTREVRIVPRPEGAVLEGAGAPARG